MDRKIDFIFIEDEKKPSVNVSASHGVTVLEALVRSKLEISHSCGGMGTCGTCRIFVENMVEGDGPRLELEADMATDRGFTEKERLACQLIVRAGLIIRR